MTTKRISAVFVALAILGAGVPATAATISLSPVASSVLPGATVSFALIADFTGEATLGGGLDVFFDSDLLGFVSFEFGDSAIVGDDPDFRRSPDVLAGELNGIGFGNFDGIDGVAEIGILTFEALASGGLAAITMAVNEGGPPDNPGGFFSLAGTPQEVDFTGANVTVVPLPAGLYLMFSALGLLGAVRTRR